MLIRLSIKQRVFAYFTTLIGMLVVLIALLIHLAWNEKLRADVQIHQYESQKLAQELRRSSDELTRMARTYIITKDEHYKAYFQAISDIREGRIPRPNDYDLSMSYWDQVIAGNKQLPSGELLATQHILSLKDKMEELAFAEEELALLHQAQSLSNELVTLEQQAFSWLERNKPQTEKSTDLSENSRFSVSDVPLLLLHGETYHLRKANIMALIDQFSSLVEQRTKNAVTQYQVYSRYLQLFALLLGALILGFGLWGYFIFSRNISAPLSRAHETLRKLHPGISLYPSFYDEHDEIGLLIQRFTKLLTHDYLTNLPNRYYFFYALRKRLETTTEGDSTAVILLNLDNFHIVNDLFTQKAGDAMLSQLALWLKIKLPENLTICRLGGDVFAVLGIDLDRNETEKLAKKCLELIASYPLVWNYSQHRITASAGISFWTSENINTQDLLFEAEQACATAKAQGGNRVSVYLMDDSERQVKNRTLLTQLINGLSAGNFSLFAQPILPCQTAGQQHPRLEILLRYQEESGHVISPTDMLASAEHYSFMAEVDSWVLQKSFNYLTALVKAGWHININISAQTLLNDNFIALLERLMISHQVKPGVVCLEITERQIVMNVSHTRLIMQHLHSLGIWFALDDFGAGFASYGFIRHLPLRSLKIDGELVRNLATDDSVIPMVQSIIHMAELLEIDVVAEYVETPLLLKRLKAMNVSQVQGQVFGLAQPIDTFSQPSSLKSIIATLDYD